MKYHHLYIYIDDNIETYNKITDLLGVKPTKFEKYKTSKEPDNKYDLWAYSVETEDEEPYFDFINKFLNILEPKFEDLKKLGVKKNDILFWLLYEYDQQCAMEFHPEEMKRLGESGIVLNIDCWQLDKT
ncbi:DUF4279 domain-containing protein [uncultured Acetobacteroides sp.]|uniref:DUF4279 domain-containing protein n=1 Tax=uncultured Acetobacteroides sp. TaxID=1760811 RepID=UPI0029F49111|nr:DUF4279 domain-containing protein [uncultured Acetobacteroides sp.]